MHVFSFASDGRTKCNCLTQNDFADVDARFAPYVGNTLADFVKQEKEEAKKRKKSFGGAFYDEDVIENLLSQEGDKDTLLKTIATFVGKLDDKHKNKFQGKMHEAINKNLLASFIRGMGNHSGNAHEYLV